MCSHCVHWKHLCFVRSYVLFGLRSSLTSFQSQFWSFEGGLQKVTNTRDVLWEVGRKLLSAPGNEDKLWAILQQSETKSTQIKHESKNNVANYLTREETQRSSESWVSCQEHIFFTAITTSGNYAVYSNGSLKLNNCGWHLLAFVSFSKRSNLHWQCYFTCGLSGWCWFFLVDCRIQTCWPAWHYSRKGSSVASSPQRHQPALNRCGGRYASVGKMQHSTWVRLLLVFYSSIVSLECMNGVHFSTIYDCSLGTLT